jgi:hypothetical protein
MITSVRDIRIADNQRRVIATSDLDEPIFRFYISGSLFATQSIGSIDVLTTGAPVPVDVFDQDEPDALPAPSAVVGLRIYWEPPAGLDAFRIERLVSGEWVSVATLSAAPVQRGYSYTVTGLADQTRHRIRVVGIAPDASETVILTRAALLIRNPDVPPQTNTATAGTLSVGAS